MTEATHKNAIRNWWEPILLVIMFWYPLRHVHWGLDFWDTGYNYANFLYMGTDHMDSMWLFSTYIANAVGHFMTKLPGGDCLVGMNLYTGMTVSVLALMGYWFCTRKLQMQEWIVFLGEMAAVSLCWCPTALLYNYLTYVFFTCCVILLYIGLTRDKMWYLFLAGICLGMNVLVRFSNLPEAAMILAVWGYALLVEWEEKEGRLPRGRKLLGRAARYTGWCLGGYLAVLAVLFGYLHIRYGMGEYIAGIQRLFAMTDKATDYKATSMLTQLVYTYLDNLYWLVRICVIAAAGILGFAVLGLVGRKNESVQKALSGVARVLWCAVALLMIGWLYYRGFCALEFDHYGAILRPGITFLTLTLGIAGIRMIQPGVSKEEKLMSGMIFLMLLLTSIGSNNGVYPSLNHLFLGAPYTLWQCFRFVAGAKKWKGLERAEIGAFSSFCKLKKCLSALEFDFFPVKTILVAFLLLFLFQSGLFGANFVFAEATGAKDVSVVVENNEILKGVKMSPERAVWMEDISAYVEEQGLKGREVILFGNIPAMSYYLQMPSSFNPWSDLDSYNVKVMRQELEAVAEEVKQGAERPVVLLDANYALYMEEGAAALESAEVPESVIEKIEKNDEKIQVLKGFAQELNYELTYRGDKFVLMQ